MLLGTVIGLATATVKHRSMRGFRLAVVQPVNSQRRPDGDVVLAADPLGSAPGQAVVLNSDGKAARELVGDETSPVRYFVAALVDDDA